METAGAGGREDTRPAGVEVEGASAQARLEASYGEVPYRGQPFTASLPDTLATVATLYGLTPPAVEHARVLELGCAEGGNLIPMAVAMPGARFLGIDLSQRQVDDGQRDIAQAGLSNVELRQGNLLDVDASLGPFDFILCHGVYSWVPPDVRDKILAICHTNLAPDGLAYLSFNTYPGWHLRGVLRDIMRYHAERMPAAPESVASAREFLSFLADASGSSTEVFHQLIREEAAALSKQRDEYVFHEYLELENQPVLFHVFVRRLEGHDLTYVGDVELDSADCRRLAPDVHAALAARSDGLVDFEQRVDFLRGRMFRRSVVCHGDRHPLRPIVAERIRTLSLASMARPVGAEPTAAGESAVRFSLPDGNALSTNMPVAKALLLHLGTQWPRRVPFPEACEAVSARLHAFGCPWTAGADELQRTVAGIALDCFPSHFVEMHAYSPPFVVRPGERPLASPLARLQATRGTRLVTNLLHVVTELHPIQRIILELLDGTRDRGAILASLVASAQSGLLNIEEEGGPVRDPERLRHILSGMIEPTLEFLGRIPLLLA